MVALAAPEVLLGFAVVDLIASRKNLKTLKRLAEEDGVEWSLSHTMFANLGAFAIRFDQPGEELALSAGEKLVGVATSQSVATKNSSVSLQRYRSSDVFWWPGHEDGNFPKRYRRQWEAYCEHFDRASQRFGRLPWRTHRTFCMYGERFANNRRGLMLRGQFLVVVPPMQTDTWVVDSLQLIKLRELGIIEKLPAIHKDEIDDRNKSDFVVKAIAVLQASWLMVQLIWRGAVQHLPITLLEIATVAFAACSLVTYMVQWDKPKDVQSVIYVPACRLPSYDEFITVCRAAAIRTPPAGSKNHGMPDTATHQSVKDGDKSLSTWNFLLISVGASILVGGIHLTAWNFVFPTPTEQLIWRVAAIAAIVLPPTYSLLISFVLSMKNLSRSLQGIYAACVQPVLLLYLLARLYLMVESFRSLYYLPPEAFLTSPTDNVPHIG
jgi:hypothetical protein